jgi:hypothetical protein
VTPISLFNPWVLLAIILAMGASAASGWKMRGDHEKAKQYEAALAYAAAYEAEVGRVADVSAKAEKDLADQRAKAKGREAKLRKELENATYRTCLVPESGRMLYNAAVRDARAAATGQPVESMRDTDAARPPGNDGRPVEVRN